MPAPWRAIEDRRERLRAGLLAIYGWYERNAELAACVLRDAEYHPLTKEMIALRFGPQWRPISEVLGAKLEHEAARGAAAGAQLLHVADAGARERPEAERRRRRDGSSHRAGERGVRCRAPVPLALRR